MQYQRQSIATLVQASLVQASLVQASKVQISMFKVSVVQASLGQPSSVQMSVVQASLGFRSMVQASLVIMSAELRNLDVLTHNCCMTVDESLLGRVRLTKEKSRQSSLGWHERKHTSTIAAKKFPLENYDV